MYYCGTRKQSRPQKILWKPLLDAICVLTGWDEFQSCDYQKIYDSMVKPAFIFDGRNILDHDELREIGFVVYALGKPLDPFLRESYN
jgi:UDPglucose 6-dehydrogenase